MILTQLFRITGEANNIIYDDGLKSTEKEKKRLLSIRLLLNGQADNDIQGYYERTKVFDIPDRLIDVEADTFDTDYAKPGARINEIEVGLEIPVGEVFKVAIKCGATAKDVHGFYAYELIS
jgi:hypothetical protein